MNTFAPIAFFAYNRPEHTKRSIEALASNPEAKYSDIFIFLDGPKDNSSIHEIEKIQAVRNYVSSISSFKSVIIQVNSHNIGCANSIINGINTVLGKSNTVIVVEDDVIVSPLFLKFMNEGLDFYKKDRRIFTLGSFCINIDIPKSYPYDIYLSRRTVSWGWATWKNRWALANWDISNYQIITNPTNYRINKFNRGGNDLYPMLLDQLNGKIDAWDIRWEYCMSLHNGYTIVPIYSLSSNCGFDELGTHCKCCPPGSRIQPADFPYNFKFIRWIMPNHSILKHYHDYYGKDISLLTKHKRYVKSVLRQVNKIIKRVL